LFSFVFFSFFFLFFFFFQAEDGIRDRNVTGVQTCALPISFATTFSVAGSSTLNVLPVTVGVYSPLMYSPLMSSFKNSLTLGFNSYCIVFIHIPLSLVIYSTLIFFINFCSVASSSAFKGKRGKRQGPPANPFNSIARFVIWTYFPDPSKKLHKGSNLS